MSTIAGADLGLEDTLNVWDFGGQDIYHGTHALFSRTRAVFVIVWHPDFEQVGEMVLEETRFRNFPLSYWLDYVRALGHAGSPVIVVQSQCDRPEQERCLPTEANGFRFLKPCWHSAKAGRGRAALLEAVRDGVQYLREQESVSVIGKGRMGVIQRLESWRKEDANKPKEQRQHRILTRAEFRQLCEDVGNVTSPDSFLDYLHNLGVVFYQPYLFQEAIVLDQSWAFDAVYAIFEREKFYRQITSTGGRFRRLDLDQTVWREYTLNEQKLFLGLMCSTGVTFLHRVADEKMGLEDEYLAPDLLPEKGVVAPQLSGGRWNEREDTPRIEFRYPFLHTGLIRSLICDAGNLAREYGVYWKYGFWVYDRSSGARALLEQRPDSDGKHGGTIVAWVQKDDGGILARWVRNRFAEHNHRFGYPNLAPLVDELPRADEMMPAQEAMVEPIPDKNEDRLDRGNQARIRRPIPVDPDFGPLPATEQDPVTVILLTVTEHETQAVFDTFLGKGRSPVQEAKGTVTYNTLGVHGDMLVVHTQCEMGAGGVGGSQQRSEDAIKHWNPVAIIAVGIAFGVDENKQKIGDVLVSLQIQDYEPCRVSSNSTTTRGDRPHASDVLCNRLKQTHASRKRDTGNWPTVHFGLVLSGEKLVDNHTFRENLKASFPEAIGGEMEARGLYAGATKFKTDWIVVDPVWWTPALRRKGVERVPHVQGSEEASSAHAPA